MGGVVAALALVLVASPLGVAMSEKRFLDPRPWAAESAPNVAETFPKIPALERHPVRCGRPNCRCAHGQLHESWRLVWRAPDGRQHHRYVRQADLAQVQAILTERRQKRMLERLALRWGLEQVRTVEQWLRDYETNHS